MGTILMPQKKITNHIFVFVFHKHKWRYGSAPNDWLNDLVHSFDLMWLQSWIIVSKAWDDTSL